MVAFDLLYLNGYDLRKLPLIERKAHLKKLIEKTDIQFSESFEVDGNEMFAHACKVGLEGVVSKVRDSRYLSGRGHDWVKKTCAQRETLTIAGFALDGNDWDGIYIGRRKGEDLIYAGKVDHGFDKTSSAELRKRLTPLIRKTQPYTKRIAHKGIWVEPELNCRDRVPRQIRRGQGAALSDCGLDSAASPLGSPEHWSATLRTTVGLTLRSEAQVVLFWGPEFVALYNDAYAPTIGDKHPRALGRPARENWAELWSDLGPLLEGVRESGHTFVAKDRPFYIERHGFGETVFFDVSYSAVPEEDGSVAGVLCIVSETTERVRAEAALRERETQLRELNETLERRIVERSNELESANTALRQAQKMEAIGQLTGGIAHDFNNLLQGIAGNLDLIRRKPGDAAKILRWSEAGLKAAERGTRLASQLLAFSRIQKLELKPFDVTRTIVSFLEMLQRSIGPTIRIENGF